MKFNFFIVAILIPFSTFASIVDQEGILRDSHGNLLIMTLERAQIACIEHGMHLPSLREWALFAIAKGARGITEEIDNAGVEKNSLANNFYYVDAISPEGIRESFFFSPFGYQETPGLKNSKATSFLSSSISPTNLDGCCGFQSQDGTVYCQPWPNKDQAVRCFPGAK